FDEISDERRHMLMREVAEGALPAEETDQFMSFMFGATAEYDLETKADEKAWAHALSATLARNNCLDEEERKKTQTRVEDVLKLDGGKELLFRHNISAPMRNWALNNLAASPADPLKRPWDPAKLEEGWESNVVGKAFAKDSVKQAREQFPTPVSFSLSSQKGALANTFGQAFGLEPTNLPPENETAAQRDKRLSAQMNHAYYDVEEPPVSNFFGFIKEEKIDPAQITPIPITFMSNELGTAVFKVIRLETPKGPRFFDHRNNRFDSARDWEEMNKLPPGKVTYPEGLELGNKLKSKITPADTTEAWIWDKLDTAAMIAGTIAGVAVIIGTGGAAAPIVAGVAAAYGGTRAGMALNEKDNLGHDVTDLSDPEIRGLWLDAGSSVLSIGAIGGGLRAAQLAAKGGKMSHVGASIVAGMTVTGNLVDAFAMGDSIRTLSKTWDKMTPEQQTKALLSLSFQFGMNAASNKSGGGRYIDGFDFKATRNTLEFGTPFDVKPLKNDPDLAPGQVAVKYDPPTEKNPYPSNFRIVYNGDKPPSRAQIDLHSRTANAMAASVSLQKKYKDLVPRGKKPKAGSAAWEASFELTKIQSETKQVADKLAQGDLDSDTRAQLLARLDELNASLILERQRYEEWAKLAQTKEGKSLVASPTAGEDQRKAIGWPEAPKPSREGKPDYAWVPDPSGKPRLKPLHDDVPPCRYDEGTGQFVYKINRGWKGEEPRDTNWNWYANNPEPNARYEYENGYTYSTDKKGRTTTVEAKLTDDPWDRHQTKQSEIGNRGVEGNPQETYDGGHLIPRELGGPPGELNVVPMQSYLNQHGEWRGLERTWGRAVRAGKDVQVKIEVEYYSSGNAARRKTPKRFIVTTTIDGVAQEPKFIKNSRTGK
ncbi:MAG: DNA/RNA non-specific endonuclease, partial [Leisingera sp.]